jgi:hypothetical protein
MSCLEKRGGVTSYWRATCETVLVEEYKGTTFSVKPVVYLETASRITAITFLTQFTETGKFVYPLKT